MNTGRTGVIVDSLPETGDSWRELLPVPQGLCEPTCLGAGMGSGCGIPTVLGAPGPSADIRVFGANNEFRLRLAVTEQDRLECWRLVHREYLAHGYTGPNAKGLRYSIHDALPDTATFLVETDAGIVGTISVFPDSPLGLPAGEVYGEELDRLGENGRLAEIGRFTIHPRYAKDRKLLMTIVEMPCLYARCILRASSTVITVNPCHANFYRRMMLFDSIAGERAFDSVCGAPAVLLKIDLVWQRKVIDWVRGEGAKPDGVNEAHRTVYRSFCSLADERRMAAKMRRRHRAPDSHFVRRYFVEEKPLVAGLSSPHRYFFEKCILAHGG